MTDSTPYRRGNLREVILERAMAVLRDRGASALSLRELARDVGVSHTAPARHFADRQELLDAVAVEGFRQLEMVMSAAIASTSDVALQAQRAAGAYVAFVIERASLADVMYRHEAGRDGEAIGQGAREAFQPLLLLFQRGEEQGLVHGASTAATLFLAALQGIAALVNCGVVPQSTVPGLLDSAVPRFVGPAPRTS